MVYLSEQYITEMEALFFCGVLGLWAWLFCETLTRKGHIFGFMDGLHYIKPGQVSRFWEWPLKYVTCPICHAGMIAIMFATTRGLGLHLFTYPVLAMAVAKVMGMKY